MLKNWCLKLGFGAKPYTVKSLYLVAATISFEHIYGPFLLSKMKKVTKCYYLRAAS